MLAAALLSSSAHAENRPASSGVFAEGALGGAGFIGSAKSAAEVGPAIGARVGYDLFSWLSIGAHLTASTHEATVPPPPEGEYFQMYTAIGEGRLGFRVRRIAVFAQGGAGFAMISSNVLSKVGITEPGESVSFAITAGGGFEYQLANRHYAFGIAGEWASFAQFENTQSVTVNTFLRYTY